LGRGCTDGLTDAAGRRPGHEMKVGGALPPTPHHLASDLAVSGARTHRSYRSYRSYDFYALPPYRPNRTDATDRTDRKPACNARPTFPNGDSREQSTPDCARHARRTPPLLPCVSYVPFTCVGVSSCDFAEVFDAVHLPEQVVIFDGPLACCRNGEREPAVQQVCVLADILQGKSVNGRGHKRMRR
jgi:hypothetical protein